MKGESCCGPTSEGHVWEATPGNVNAGHWCPTCAIDRRAVKRSLSIEEMQRIAHESGEVCVSSEPNSHVSH